MYNLDLGYQLNRNFAVEGGYIGSNNASYTASGGNLGAPASASTNVSGWDVKAVGMLPIASRFSLLGKVGLADISESDNMTGPGGSGSFNGSKTDVTYGVGAKYDLTNSVALRFDVDRYSVGSSSNFSRENLWAFGVAYKFF